MAEDVQDEPSDQAPETQPSGSSIIVDGLGYHPGVLRVNNWIDRESSDFHFMNRQRTGLVTEIVLHETVTRSHDDTVRVLKPASPANPGGRNLGVHFIVEHTGEVFQHADVVRDMCWHAGVHNGPSVGIEVVNPYEPRFLPKTNCPWQTVIDAPWAAGGRYVVPTPAQAEATFQLVMFLVQGGGEPPAPKLQVPLSWPGLVAGRMAFGKVQGADQLKPGIYAHHYFAHADGAWLVLYTWLRAEGGMEPEDAYRAAVRAAKGAKSAGVVVSDLLKGE